MAETTPTLAPFVYNSLGRYLFSRTYSIAIGAPKQTSAFQYSNVQVGTGDNIQPPSPLRITFDIEKIMAGTSSKSKFEIYNLSLETRNQIKKGYLVRLQAGYRGLMNTIFVGNVLINGCTSKRHGADIITTLECGEGESSIQMAKLDKSYPPGVTLSAIIADIVLAMGTDTPQTDGGIGTGNLLGIPDIVYARGTTIHGACKDSLNKLLTPAGLRWSVQNGNLNIVPVTNAITTSAVVISSGVFLDAFSNASRFDQNNSTGMIGVPSLNSQGLLQFEALLNPNIIPGGYVQIKSENTALNGFYKVLKVKYEGDTHENKWQVKCEATKIKAKIL